jgi:hypothetical protein
MSEVPCSARPTAATACVRQILCETMRLLLCSDTGEFSFYKDLVGDDTIPPYAILSHTWGADAEEVTFEDITNGTGKDKPGYEKIRFCEDQARIDGLQYFWVDTCCIDKSNNNELSEAINSMFRWYRNAAKCYVYLSDVPRLAFDTSDKSNQVSWESALRKSRWFTRGWTLQELLAPRSVEFFSRERKGLGDKSSLEQQIHEITCIPKSALQGTRLSEFSVNERLSWIERRQTKLEEDKAYSLLGIFDVYIPLIYGEGTASAFRRLREEIDKLEKCIQDLRLTDPRDDKKRIEDTKGGLLEDSYRWILENTDFQQWRSVQQIRMLWIKGDPGKGKTMLLCGIINELIKSTTHIANVSFFFCQATDACINNATAVLRGLMYLIVDQQPSLISHIRKKHDHAKKNLFEDANAWVALCEIFTNILRDSSLNNTYLIIDALDECVTDLPKLLDFIAQKSFVSPRVKWIVSSRNWPDIEERLERTGHKVRLCLELNAESISTAVGTYIQYKVLQLAQQKKYDDKTRDTVLDHLFSNANNTFLWVALVCQNLEKIPRWKTLVKLNAFPPGLDSLYKRMVEQIRNSDNADLCKHILASIAIVYRPITLKELTSLVKMLKNMSNDPESLGEIIGLCGSFLTIREGTIYFVHQSAKDYLVEHASSEIFSDGCIEEQQRIVLGLIEAMDKALQRDVYSLRHPGCSIDEVEYPDPDPLAPIRYACIYWVDHLCEIKSSYNEVGLYNNGTIYVFLRQHFLHWLEALSLIKGISEGVMAMAKLIGLLTVSYYLTKVEYLRILIDLENFV